MMWIHDLPFHRGYRRVPVAMVRTGELGCDHRSPQVCNGQATWGHVLREFICLATILFSWLIAVTVQADPLIRGMSYRVFHPTVLAGAGSDESLRRLALTGANAVAINVSWYQDTIGSLEISADARKSPTIPSIEHAIDIAHARGMQVLLKPNLDLKTDEWRAFIKPRANQTAAWFQAYGRFLGVFADLACRKRVAMMAIGTEMNALEAPEYDRHWRALVRDVRSRYKGRLVYCANWNAASRVGGGYSTVGWWDAVDVVGINAYFPLSEKRDSTVAEMTTACAAWADEIEAWLCASGREQKVLLTEVGYASFDGAAMTPWIPDSSRARTDVQEQADAYESLLATVWQRPWCEGLFLWHWDPAPDAGERYPKGFTPQGKPAENVVSRFYHRPLGPHTGGPLRSRSVKGNP